MMRVRRIVTYAAIALALLMLLGSCDYKTRRETESSAADAATSATDGFDEWAWLPALSALVAIVLLGNVAATQRSGRS